MGSQARSLTHNIGRRSPTDEGTPVPRLCLLDGIAIWINTRDHLPPHFHAKYGGDEVHIRIQDMSVMTGRLPATKQRLLFRWAVAHSVEIAAKLDLARQGLPHEPIAPTTE